MTDDAPRGASIAGRITHGTATPASFPSVIPGDKRAKEVFWASALVERLPELQSLNPTTVSCQDDSNGNHDVIVILDNGKSIGIQVTELTYELERARRAQNEKFVSDVLVCFRKRSLSSERSLLVSCAVPFVAGGRYIVPKPESLADACTEFLEGATESIIELERVRVRFEWVDKVELYVPSVSGIGVDCNLDGLPRTLEMYCDAISCLRDKKVESNSPWLLIWSQSFWRDKHWLGKETLAHMHKSFTTSSFVRVFFVESMDGAGFFEANLEVHAIKA